MRERGKKRSEGEGVRERGKKRSEGEGEEKE